MIKISQFIKFLRKDRGMSQQEIADRLGMSRPSYILVEQGKKELSLSEAQKISNIFGISLKDMETGIIPDYEKYKEMILSFLRFFSSNGDGKVPKTKLAKLLYLADFSWFYEKMESMSGMQYRRIQYGPVPDLYFRALDELEEEGRINRDNKNSDVTLISENEGSKRSPLNKLNKQELDLIKKIAEKWKDKKTRDIVNFTHNQLPFKLCAPDEIIPYELIIQEDPKYVY
ncbi:MAG: type II toxin-antitoxin system antitoxin SocA domain-containing protein [Minisyncoccales bacterium]|jgi:transcriptional regulator with XRE-family HTH domain